MDPKRGWYSRGYLPHLNLPGMQFLTWRLADSLPAGVLVQIKTELSSLNDLEFRKEYARRIEAYCDSGYGECLLGQPRIARIVQESSFENDCRTYRLQSWVVMPNHVHAILEISEEANLSEVLRILKGATARKINLMLDRTGPLWQRDYFDRRIRDAEHLERVCRYVEWNPVKASLVSDPARWEFSSANGDSQKRLEFLRNEKGISWLANS